MRALMRLQARGWPASCWFALAALFASCGGSEIGEVVPDPSFDGELSTGDDAQTPPDSGDSVCFILEQEGCGEGEACVRGADGVRFCVETLGVPPGAPCSPSRYDECEAGSFCIASSESARCLRLCVEGGAPCEGESRCEFVIVTEGQRVGVCSLP